MIQFSPPRDDLFLSGKPAPLEHFHHLLQAVNTGCDGHVYPAGIKLFNQGALPREIYFVETGLTKLVCTEQTGRELIVDLRFPGSLLGLSAAITKQTHPVSAITAADCQLVRVSSGQFLELLRRDAGLSLSVHEVLSGEVINQAARIAEIGSLTARQRLENFIWQLTKQTVQSDLRNSRLQLPLKQWEMAQFLAITPAYLCQLLAGLESEGVIMRKNGWIIVCALEILWHLND